MIGDELKNYIQDALKSGKSKEEIRQSLIGAGRSEAEVVQALNSADSATAQTPQEAQVPAASGTKPNTISGFFDTIRNHLKRPQTYYVFGAILLIVGAIFFYQKVILKEALSLKLRQQSLLKKIKFIR